MAGEALVQKLQRIFLGAAVEFPEIRLAYLFGSRAGDQPVGPLSDCDVAVLSDRDSAGPAFRSRMSLYLAKRLNAARVDMVLLNHAPVELAYSVLFTGDIIFETDVQTRVDYEARVMGLYFDYLPVLRAQRWVQVSRFAAENSKIPVA